MELKSRGACKAIYLCNGSEDRVFHLFRHGGDMVGGVKDLMKELMHHMNIIFFPLKTNGRKRDIMEM